MNDGISTLRSNILLIRSSSKDTSLQLILMEPMLWEVVGFAIKFEKGVPVDIGLKIKALTGEIEGRFSKGK